MLFLEGFDWAYSFDRGGDACAPSSELSPEMVIVIGVVSEVGSTVTLVIGECVPFELPGSSVPEVSCPEHGCWSRVFSLLPVSVTASSDFWDSVALVCTGVGCSVFPRLVCPWSVCDVWRDSWGCGEFVLG